MTHGITLAYAVASTRIVHVIGFVITTNAIIIVIELTGLIEFIFLKRFPVNFALVVIIKINMTVLPINIIIIIIWMVVVAHAATVVFIVEFFFCFEEAMLDEEMRLGGCVVSGTCFEASWIVEVLVTQVVSVGAAGEGVDGLEDLCFLRVEVVLFFEE